jgi:16S rRNA (uracil1498-N3)-methyltransferase
MPQFLVDPEDVRRQGFRLRGPEAFHVLKVLRYTKGQELELFDGHGGRYTGVIVDIGDDGSVSGKVTATLARPGDATAAPLDLYLGLLKASHWDDALDKCVQLGVASFTPLLTPRTVVLLHEVERAKSKLERWGRIVTAAAKQCGRADLPPVREPAQFRDAIRAVKDKGLVLVAWEGMKGASAGAVLRRAIAAGRPERVSVFVGPEGGFSVEEIELAEAEGALLFGLGPRVLRAETAAVAAAAVVQYELGAL